MSPAGELLRHMEIAAETEGKTLGEWLYESLAAPFEFTGEWSASGKQGRRRKYNAAAEAFARKIAAVLAEDEPHG